MKLFSALTTRSRKAPPRINFKELTRSLIDFDTDIETLQDEMASLPKARRGSMAIGEQRFLDISERVGGRHIIKAGSNDGRHTRHFLASTDALIHVFEPNVFDCPGFEGIFSNEQLYLNAFGLSDTTALLPLALPRRILDLDLGRVSGVAAVEDRAAVSSAEFHVAALARAAADFGTEPQIANGPVGLWLDVEGHIDLALAGFGRNFAERVEVALVEVSAATPTPATPTPERSPGNSATLASRFVAAAS